MKKAPADYIREAPFWFGLVVLATAPAATGEVPLLHELVREGELIGEVCERPLHSRYLRRLLRFLVVAEEDPLGTEEVDIATSLAGHRACFQIDLRAFARSEDLREDPARMHLDRDGPAAVVGDDAALIPCRLLCRLPDFVDEAHLGRNTPAFADETGSHRGHELQDLQLGVLLVPGYRPVPEEILAEHIDGLLEEVLLRLDDAESDTVVVADNEVVERRLGRQLGAVRLNIRRQRDEQSD